MRSKEDMESGSGSEQFEEKSGNELESNEQQKPKKKRYHRHTARQIQEMEAYVNMLFLSYFFSFPFLRNFHQICFNGLSDLPNENEKQMILFYVWRACYVALPLFANLQIMIPFSFSILNESLLVLQLV